MILIVNNPPATDNVWDVDCFSFFLPGVNGLDVDGAYFVIDGTISLIRWILRGIDLGRTRGHQCDEGNAWPARAGSNFPGT